MKNKVQCSSCGAMFDDELETCPYCGAIHLRGAEKAYMRDLGRIRDNLEDLQNVKHKDSCREGVFVAKLIIGTILTLLALTLAVYLYSAVDERAQVQQLKEAIINEEKEHGKAMGKYDRAYQSTKKEVLDKTHHFARISRKGMLLGIIGFLIILYIFIASALSGGSLEKIIRRHQASKNYDAVRSQIQTYLENGQYSELFEYGEYYHLTDTEKGDFQAYYPVFWCANSYGYVEQAVQMLTDYGDYKEDSALYLSEKLADFYQRTYLDQYKKYEGAISDQNRESLQQMRDRVSDLLVEKLPLTREDVEPFPEMTSAQINQIIIGRLLQNED